MKKLILAATLVASGSLGTALFAHGGTYRGPGDTVPPGGGGGGGGGAGIGPGPTGPTSGGDPGAPASGPGLPGSGSGTASGRATSPTGRGPTIDLTAWTFWWEFNKEPYLNLKSSIWRRDAESGSSGLFLGRGQKEDAKDSLRPDPRQIRETVVPALLEALETESNNDIVTGAMIALAKIGDVSSESGESAFQTVLEGFLTDDVQEISETAAIALGILANPASIDLLSDLMLDTPAGRAAVGSGEVPYRTRSFAAYGLGLIAANPSVQPGQRARIVDALVRGIQTDDTKSRDLRVACLIALGTCPLDRAGRAPAEDAEGAQPPSASFWAQMDFLRGVLEDSELNHLVRAHAPTSMARLLERVDPKRSPQWEDAHAHWRSYLVTEVGGRLDKRSRDANEVVQSAVLALGQVGTNAPADVSLRDALASVPKNVSDQQARNFATIAMAQAGATGREDFELGVQQAGRFLLEQLDGKSSMRPWAGLAIGVFGHRAKTSGIEHPMLTEVTSALRTRLAKERQPHNLGAYAIGAGILGDIESSGLLMEHLQKVSDDEARGYVALALGLMSERQAIESIQRIIEESQYRPELLKQAAIALGLLGDKNLVDQLLEMLQTSRGLATQAALASALGFIGDRRSIDPLVAMLRNEELTQRARGFAAVALGIVADKQPLPWNTAISVDLNYRAATSTLVDPSGTGILDIL